MAQRGFQFMKGKIPNSYYEVTHLTIANRKAVFLVGVCRNKKQVIIIKYFTTMFLKIRFEYKALFKTVEPINSHIFSELKYRFDFVKEHHEQKQLKCV